MTNLDIASAVLALGLILCLTGFIMLLATSRNPDHHELHVAWAQGFREGVQLTDRVTQQALEFPYDLDTIRLPPNPYERSKN